MPSAFDDLFDPTERFDAAQFAMDGLLSIYFDDAIKRSPERVKAILDRAARETGYRPENDVAATPSSRRAGVSKLHRTPGSKWLVGLAVAACAAFAFFYLFESQTPTAHAGEAEIRAVAMRLVLLPNIYDDPETVKEILSVIDTSRRQRDEAIHLAANASDAQSRSKAVDSALHPWAYVYRRLRDLGRFDEAFVEIQRCMEYCRTDPSLGEKTSWYNVILADLGNHYLSMADLSDARQAYQASIHMREKSRQAFLTRKDNPVSVPDRASNEAFELCALYRSMSRVAIAEGNFQDAHKWLQLSDRAFRTYFAAVCEAGGTTSPADGDALAAFRATPDAFQSPPSEVSEEEQARFAAQYKGFVPSSNLATKLHAHLYFTACLALVEGDISKAEQTLRAAGDVPLYDCADEDRLDFFEPLLAARIAIADRRYEQALALIARAEQHAGLPPCATTANNRPIAPTRIAELTLLKGVALLGLDEKSVEGRKLVEKALAVPRKLSATLPLGQREGFLKQFETWKKLSEIQLSTSQAHHNDGGMP